MTILARYPGFRWLWFGQLFSQLGNAVFLVMGLWEIQLRSPFLLSIAGLAMLVPGAFAVVGGAFVDRHDPRRLMLWTDVLRGAAVALGLVLLVVPGGLVPVIIGVLALNSLGASLFGPAESVVLPWLVEDNDLPGANGLYSVTSQLAQALGSAIGGAAIAAIGIATVFGLDMGSFWVSALAITLMMRIVAARPRVDATAAAPGPGPQGGVLANIREGWRGLSEMPWLVRLFPLIVATNFFFAAAFTMLPYWSRHTLHTGSLGFGLMEACLAAGMVAGSLAAGLFARWPVRTVVVIAALMLGLLVLGFALSSWALASGPLLFGAGAANGILNALVFTIMQRAIPDAIRGRAFGLFITLVTLITPLGALAAGLVLNVLPLWWSWVAAALAGLLLGVYLWRGLPADFELPAGEAVPSGS